MSASGCSNVTPHGSRASVTQETNSVHKRMCACTHSSGQRDKLHKCANKLNTNSRRVTAQQRDQLHKRAHYLNTNSRHVSTQLREMCTNVHQTVSVNSKPPGSTLKTNATAEHLDVDAGTRHPEAVASVCQHHCSEKLMPTTPVPACTGSRRRSLTRHLHLRRRFPPAHGHNCPQN